MVHGSCAVSQGAVAHGLIHLVDAVAHSHWGDWTYMQPLAEKLAEQGFVVLMIGMPDDDQRLADDKVSKVVGSVLNDWPARFTAVALNEAIDHLRSVAPARLGVEVDADRIALVGHSCGGAAALYAAAHHCRDRIKAVAALNPGHIGIDKKEDCREFLNEYHKGKPFSGENGDLKEGQLPYLSEVKAATYVYGSLAEFNGALDTWPNYESLFEKIGSPTKELYVDNVHDPENPLTSLHAHLWLVEDIADHDDDHRKALATLTSFLRRHVIGSDEAAPCRPDQAKSWQTASAKKAQIVFG